MRQLIIFAEDVPVVAVQPLHSEILGITVEPGAEGLALVRQVEVDGKIQNRLFVWFKPLPRWHQFSLPADSMKVAPVGELAYKFDPMEMVSETA